MKTNQTNNKPAPLSWIHQVKYIDKSQKLPDPYPGVVGLRRGDKQRFNNANLEWIELTFENCGPEYTRAFFNLSERTLQAVLRRAERKHRPTYRTVDKALDQGKMNEVKIFQNQADIGYLADVLFEHIERSESRWQATANFNQLLSNAYGLYAKALKNEPKNTGSFHNINRANLRSKVTNLEISRSKVNVIEIEEPGRLLLPGSRTTRLSPRQRYEQSKRRGKRRV